LGVVVTRIGPESKLTDKRDFLGESQPASEPEQVTAGFGTSLVMALRLFSRLPTGSAPHLVPDLDRIARVAPIASIIITIIPVAVLVISGLLRLPPLFGAGLAVAAGVIVSGAMSEDALADAMDGLFGGQTAERRLAIMKDSRHGTYGVAALCLLLILRVGALAAALESGPWIPGGMWVAASVVGRSGSLWLAFLLQPARPDGLAASAGQISRAGIALGTALAVLVAAAFGVLAMSIAAVLLALAVAALFILVWARLCQRLIGGQSGDVIGALGAVIEIGALGSFLAFL
jgi:adenosylcobinamide-GDP ribazoletransferase